MDMDFGGSLPNPLHKVVEIPACGDLDTVSLYPETITARGQGSLQGAGVFHYSGPATIFDTK